MTVKQISIFLENKPGQLAEFARLLEQHQIDMRALSLADAEDFGILRIIVDDAYKTACVLKEEGYVCSITPVLAVEVSDRPGSLVKVLDILGENQVNLEYSYAFTARRKDVAYLILRVEDNEKAANALRENGIRIFCQSELPELFS